MVFRSLAPHSPLSRLLCDLWWRHSLPRLLPPAVAFWGWHAMSRQPRSRSLQHAGLPRRLRLLLGRLEFAYLSSLLCSSSPRCLLSLLRRRYSSMLFLCSILPCFSPSLDSQSFHLRDGRERRYCLSWARISGVQHPGLPCKLRLLLVSLGILQCLLWRRHTGSILFIQPSPSHNLLVSHHLHHHSSC